jgi:flagellar basal-body rod protein FlgB
MRIFQGVELVHRALDYHLERHNVLAGNVANVDTPGYRPVELRRIDDGTAGWQARVLRVTSAAHFALGAASATGMRAEVVEDTTVGEGADGNAVSLEHEMSKLAANDLRYEGAVKIVSGQLATLRYAANDFSGG